MHREAASHKGDNGRVAVVGGSRCQHGAPLFAALAAEASGVDLVYVIIPRFHAEVARNASLNFQVHPLAGEEFAYADVEPVLRVLADVDAAIIGPGIGRDAAALTALSEFIAAAPCALVLDATALQPWTLAAIRGKRAVVTPHRGELERMGLSLKQVPKAAKQSGTVFLCKGQADTVMGTDGEREVVEGGNAGLTVGGTGDSLSGLVCGLIAQGMELFPACVAASTVIKRAGSLLFHEYGYAYGTRRVIEQIPHLVHTLNR